MNEIADITETSGTAWPAPAHDASGNMTSAPRPLDLGNSFDLTWDAWNRLVEVGDGSATVATYRYDGASRRVSKDDGTHTRHYYYSDRWQVLEERLDAGTSADRQYVWGVKSIDDLILRDDAELRLYALNDAMGSVTAVVAASGSVQERYGYDGFGAPRYMDASFSPRTGSDYDWETLFDGYRYDTDTGYYQVRYRYLHPKLGRWLSRDLIGEIADRNLYRFNYNNQVKFVDPNGLSGIQFGKKGRTWGWGDPTFVFDYDSWMDLANGAAVTMDGLIPIYDPLADLYQNGDIWSDDYEPLSDWERDLYNKSQTGGQVAQVCLLSATPFRSFTRARQPITHFGGPLQTGQWVITGGPTARNWLMSGAKPSWLLPGNQTVATALPGSLRWPSGWQWTKGILGQRIYAP